MSAPTVEFNDRTYVMVERETGQLVQAGPVVVVSRAEVEAVVAKLERYKAQRSEAYDDAAKKKLSAYKKLLGQAESAEEEPAG